jgi:hypothetical protein
MNAKHSDDWKVGIARRVITPGKHVELAGLGYYLNRTPERIRDNLAATAFVIGNEQGQSVVLVAMDLMYNDASFTRTIREHAAARTDIPAEAICVNFSHSHNAPTAGYARGVGEIDRPYLQFAAKQAADAVVEAWREKQPACLRVGSGELTGISFNRTRENGPVDTTLSVLRADTLDGKPLAVAVNYHCHLNAHMDSDLHAVSRDWSGEMIDQLEAAMPGVTAMYLQGTCGDVMVPPDYFVGAHSFEVASGATKVALGACERSRKVSGQLISAIIRRLTLPTRRWRHEEVMEFRREGLHRQSTGDTTNWLDGIARVIVGNPKRLPLRYGGSLEKAVAAVSRFAIEWSDEVLPTLASRPEVLETELHALRIGDVWFIAHQAELFTTLGLQVRRQWPHADLFMLGYSNGGIGYLPDAYDIKRRSYAAEQSPKFTGQFPFTQESGHVMVAGMLKTLHKLENAG